MCHSHSCSTRNFSAGSLRLPIWPLNVVGQLGFCSKGVSGGTVDQEIAMKPYDPDDEKPTNLGTIWTDFI